jgi:hypothetical protein
MTVGVPDLSFMLINEPEKKLINGNVIIKIEELTICRILDLDNERVSRHRVGHCNR